MSTQWQPPKKRCSCCSNEETAQCSFWDSVSVAEWCFSLIAETNKLIRSVFLSKVMKTNVTKSTDRSTLECDCLLMARPKNKSGNVRQVEKMKLNQVCDSITPLMSHTQMVLLSHCPLYFFFFSSPMFLAQRKLLVLQRHWAALMPVRKMQFYNIRTAEYSGGGSPVMLLYVLFGTDG